MSLGMCNYSCKRPASPSLYSMSIGGQAITQKVNKQNKGGMVRNTVLQRCSSMFDFRIPSEEVKPCASQNQWRLHAVLRRVLKGLGLFLCDAQVPCAKLLVGVRERADREPIFRLTDKGNHDSQAVKIRVRGAVLCHDLNRRLGCIAAGRAARFLTR